ncbi:NADH-quinone oxidoreductase subunit A [Sulfolobus tengchongensis]|uniref:NADH-quinone oxidoreductase subunit A n=1 Tax=Sulfolobus tengchongensis TaxID=207809 RepID=A0AAX4KZM4_9CREN
MSLTQAILTFGIPIVVFLAAGYGGYKFLSLVVPSKPNPLKVSRFEAGNIPTGLGRLWFPLQYYGYLLVYTTLEPIIILLLPVAYSDYYSSMTAFRNLLLIVVVFIVLLYPILYYSIRQINVLNYWEMRR